MKENLLKVKLMDTEFINDPMENILKECGKIIRLMVIIF